MLFSEMLCFVFLADFFFSSVAADFRKS
jgi:hypothetical protein